MWEQRVSGDNPKWIVRSVPVGRHREDKAVSAAGALAKRDDDVASMKADILVIRWMLGFVLAFQVAVLFKLFAH